jgi:hypothetical protein
MTARFQERLCRFRLSPAIVEDAPIGCSALRTTRWTSGLRETFREVIVYITKIDIMSHSRSTVTEKSYRL